MATPSNVCPFCGRALVRIPELRRIDHEAPVCPRFTALVESTGGAVVKNQPKEPGGHRR